MSMFDAYPALTLPRVARLTSYAGWSIADQLITIGAPRLLLYPWLAAFLGGQSFASLILALTFMQLVGTSPSNGLCAYVFREAPRHDASALALMIRTVLLLALLGTVPFTLLLAFAAGPISRAYNDPALADLLPGFAVYLLLLNLAETTLALSLVRRRFRYVAVVHLLSTGILFVSVPLCRSYGLRVVSIAYVASGCFACLATLRSLHDGRWAFSLTFAKGASRVWLPLSLGYLILLSSGYLDRLALGYWWDKRAVVDFFAAVNISAILVVPATFASNFFMTLLGKYDTPSQFGRTFYATYAVGVGLCSLLLFLVGTLLGARFLAFFYPQVAGTAEPLWKYAVASNAALSIQVLVRPFIVKFNTPGIIPVIVAVTVLARIGPLLLLVPTMGALGAAQAMCFGSFVAAVLWLSLYVRSFVFSRDARALQPNLVTAG